jgi:uncharacterized membrane protein
MNAFRRGYPLGALFVLMTICAVLVAGVAPLVHSLQAGNVDVTAFAAAMGIGSMAGMILGMILGLFQFRIGRGVLMGAGVGAIVGAAAGALALLNSQQIFAAATAMTAGSGLVIAVAVMMRRNTSG